MGIHSPGQELLLLDKKPLHIDTITHYTSIPTFFKILRSGNILFNRIDNVNDLAEKDNLNERKNYCRLYVSCFSTNKKESIPMWRMYTHKETGIMLKFKFRKGCSIEELFMRDCIYDATGYSYNIIPNDKGQDIRVQLDAVKVVYTNQTKHYPIMNIVEENQRYDVPDHFGIEKSKAWSYEEEIRFRAILKEGMNCKDELPDNIPRLFARLNFKSLEKLTIIFNPWIDKEDWVDIIQDFILKQKIDLRVEYRNSNLYNRIRLTK